MSAQQKIAAGFDEMVTRQDRLLEWASRPEILAQRAKKVSEWWVGLHVEHLGKVADTVLDYLERFLEAGGEKGVGGPNFIGRLVLLTRFIPRGSAPVPDFLSPDDLEPHVLRSRLEATSSRLSQLEPQVSKLAGIGGTQPHPLLGHFTVRQWIDFLVIHDHHHYKIIRDIEKTLAKG